MCSEAYIELVKNHSSTVSKILKRFSTEFKKALKFENQKLVALCLLLASVFTIISAEPVSTVYNTSKLILLAEIH